MGATPNGANPVGGLCQDSSGNLYGTTNFGGNLVRAPSTKSPTAPTRSPFWPPSKRGRFRSTRQHDRGQQRQSRWHHPRRRDQQRRHGFRARRGSSTPTVLASFDDTDGREPQANVVMDSHGNLYGTTEFGGSANSGTIFESSPAAARSPYWRRSNSLCIPAPVRWDNGGTCTASHRTAAALTRA